MSKKSIEEELVGLEKMIRQLESQEISLEESFQLYEQGMKLVREINTRIDTVEAQVLRIETDREDGEYYGRIYI